MAKPINCLQEVAKVMGKGFPFPSKRLNNFLCGLCIANFLWILASCIMYIVSEVSGTDFWGEGGGGGNNIHRGVLCFAGWLSECTANHTILCGPRICIFLLC